MKLEELLYVGNKKAKQFRDDIQELRAVLDGDAKLPSQYLPIFEGYMTKEAVNRYIDGKAEKYKADYTPYYDYEPPKDEIMAIIAEHNRCEIIERLQAYSPIVKDMYYLAWNQIKSLKYDKERKMKKFYEEKSDIIGRNKDLFKPVGIHVLSSHTRVCEDENGEADYYVEVRDAVLAQGEKYSFHVPTHKYFATSQFLDSLPRLGELGGQISSELEENHPYAHLSLEEINEELVKWKRAR